MRPGPSGVTGSQRVGPITEIVDLLFELTDHLKAQFAVVTAGLRLSVPQARTLLRMNGPISMRELAALIKCDASNMTGIVDGLHVRGLVERRPLPADRRVKQVVLTDTGAELQATLRRRLAADVPALGALDDADRQVLHTILRRAVERS